MKHGSIRPCSVDAEPEPLDWLGVRRGRDAAHGRGRASSRNPFAGIVTATGVFSRARREPYHGGREHVLPVDELGAITSELVQILIVCSASIAVSRFEDARRQLGELASLQPGWHGEGSKSVPVGVVKSMRSHLEIFERVVRTLWAGAEHEQPWLAASEDGSLGVDWRHESRQLAMTYDATGSIDYYAQGPDFEREGEIVGDGREDVERIASWLFTGRW